MFLEFVSATVTKYQMESFLGGNITVDKLILEPMYSKYWLAQIYIMSSIKG
jgi:hypothetical protein